MAIGNIFDTQTIDFLFPKSHRETHLQIHFYTKPLHPKSNRVSNAPSQSSTVVHSSYIVQTPNPAKPANYSKYINKKRPLIQ